MGLGISRCGEMWRYMEICVPAIADDGDEAARRALRRLGIEADAEPPGLGLGSGLGVWGSGWGWG